VVWQYVFKRGRGFVRGHLVLFIGPRAEVEQLAALGAERAMRVILPLGRFVAVGTLHKDVES
jgi:hypothetical protein